MASPMRTVDTFPMILEHLGYDTPAGIDGRLRPAEQRSASSRDDAMSGSAS